MNSLKECSVCFENFDTMDRKPCVISPCGHYICEQCFDTVTPKKCPICRQSMDIKIINRPLMSCIETKEIEKIAGHGNCDYERLINENKKFKKQIDSFQKREIELLDRLEAIIESLVLKKRNAWEEYNICYRAKTRECEISDNSLKESERSIEIYKKDYSLFDASPCSVTKPNQPKDSNWKTNENLWNK